MPPYSMGVMRARIFTKFLTSRVLILILVLSVEAHYESHDSIFRVQLWNEEGMTRNQQNDEPVKAPPSELTKNKKLSVKNDELIGDMYKTFYESDLSSVKISRYTRKRGRHVRRRKSKKRGTRDKPDERFHFHKQTNLNVIVYNDSSEYGISGIYPEAGDSGYRPAMNLMQNIEDIDTEDDKQLKKQLALVPKCCPIGQNISSTLSANGTRYCQKTELSFEPEFYEKNISHIWSYENNLFETIVGNPCLYDRYKLEPEERSTDEYYLLANGTIYAPFHSPTYLTTNNYCMETFWNETNPAGVTRPLVCYPAPSPTQASSSTALIIYAIGLLVSVPFLLATALIYTCITELRDTHGKSLSCHTFCMAVAFFCLAITQLAGQMFPNLTCKVMAFVIQFSFVSCFFWLNVMCFETWINVRHYLTVRSNKRDERIRFIYYCSYAVTLPMLLLFVTIAMDLSPAVPTTYLKPDIGVVGCWFKTDKAALPYFYGPVACILCINLLLFFLISRSFANQYAKLENVTAMEVTEGFGSTADWLRLSEQLDVAIGEMDGTASVVSTPTPLQERHNDFKRRWKKYRKIFRMCCMLSLLMGLSWILEVISWVAGSNGNLSVWSLFDVINSLQGLIIFIIYVLQKPVRKLVWHRVTIKSLSATVVSDTEFE